MLSRMSVLLRLVGMMVRNGSNNTPILSRHIINEAKKGTKKMLDHVILQIPVLDESNKSQSDNPGSSENTDQVFNFEQRIKALLIEMGEHRAITNADVMMSRLEGAWRLQQESHHHLVTQYDKLVNKLRTFAGDIGFEPAIVSADDVLMIVINLDQRWRQIQKQLGEVTGALHSKNSQMQELAAFLGLETPVTKTRIFDDIKVRWTEEQSKFSDLEKALKEKEEESRVASQTLQNIANLMGVVPPKNKDALMASIQGIWTRSQRKITDLQQELFHQKEQIQRSGEDLQNLAKIFGVAPTPAAESNILDALVGKWEETKSLVSQLRSSLLHEKDKNAHAHEALQRLADFMGAETSGGESTIVGSMMDRWAESRREVVDLQRALMEEREKTKQAQEALQAHLSRPGPVLSSVTIQTDDHQAVSNGQLFDKSFQTGRSLDATSPGIASVSSDDNTLEDSLDDVSLESNISPETTVAVEELSCESGRKTQLSHHRDAKREPEFYREVEQELYQIKEHLHLSISLRSQRFTSSASREVVHLGPRCLSLKTFGAGGSYRPPSRSSLLRSASAIASAISCLDPSSDASIKVTKMSDLIPWEESRCRIELGSGVSGTVFLFRHAVSKIPVAAKFVEYQGECFQNEVRIHQAVSGLPWFPRFYGSFEITGDQGVLAMEFIGDNDDDRSYTISDCTDKSFLKVGPDLTRDQWFVVLHDVAEGLRALHSKGFLSNDLKEDNVLVVKESGFWRAKIIDLGWASEIATPFVMPQLDEDEIDFYRSGRGCQHVAPECVLGGRPFSPSSDVYSFGRLLASVGRAMRYDDYQSYGMEIYQADEHQRPTVEEVIDQLYEMQLIGGGDDEDDPGSSSC